MSHCGPRCEERRTTYSLEVEKEHDMKKFGRGRKESRITYCLEAERERDGVRLWTRMRSEQDSVQAGGGEGA